MKLTESQKILKYIKEEMNESVKDNIEQGKPFSMNDYKTHSHHSESRFRCPKCCSGDAVVKIDNNKYECRDCGIQFTSKESLNSLNEEVDDASFKKAVLDDFNEFIQDKYGIFSVEDLIDQLEHVTEEDVNDYCSGKFYDIESEKDLDDMNKAEEIIRKEYSVESEDDSYFEPTEEDIAEMKHWL